MRIHKLLICLTLLYSHYSFSYAKDAYQEAISIPPTINNIGELIERSRRDGWQHERKTKQHTAKINHKGYFMHVEFLTTPKQVTIKLIDFKKNNCKKKCEVVDDRILGWLLRLRKSIAIYITRTLRDQAREAHFNNSAL